MATVIANQLETFSNDIGQMTEMLANVRSTSRQAFEELDSLTAMWEGSANQAFRDQFLADADNMENLCKALEKYISALSEDHKRYSKCETDISEVIQNLKV